MNSIYSLLVSNVVLAALLAVLAVVLTKLWRNPHFAHALWLLVLVKLITPPLIQVPMPHFTFGNGEHAVNAEPGDSHGLSRLAKTIATGKSIVQEPASVGAITELAGSEEASRPATQARQPTTSPLVFWPLFLSHWSEWLLVLSGAGTLVLTCVAFCRHRQLLSIFAEARAPDSMLNDDVKQISRQVGLVSCPAVRVTDALVCPLVSIGGWKQFVLLPSRLLIELSREQTRSIVAHELAHLRRRDHWVRCFELIVLALFWWNPIAWWASRRLRQAEEECCDAWVVWALPECRRSYGQALLRTVEILTEGRIVTPIAGAEFGKHLFTRRIEMIMKKETHHHMPWLVCAVTLLVGITVLPLAAVVSDEPGRKGSAKNLDAVEQSSSVERVDVATDEKKDVATAEKKFDRSLIEADRKHLGARIAARSEYLAAITAAKRTALDSGNLESVRQLAARHKKIENELKAERKEFVRMEHQLAVDARVAIRGDGFVLKTLRNAAQAYSNRPYKWENVPENLAGWTYTQIDGGDTPRFRIEVREAGVVYVTAETSILETEHGWTARPELAFIWYPGRNPTQARPAMCVFSKKAKAGQVIEVPHFGWAGTLVLIPPARAQRTDGNTLN